MTTALLVALLLAAPPKPAPAPAAEGSSEQGDVKKAKELFQSGQRLYKQARYAEAIAKFEEAYLVRPHPVIYFNIGKCYEQLGETAKALRAYRDYLRLAPDAKDKETVSDAIANLERRLRERGMQQLMVFADPPNAKIAVDGKELGSSPASVELVAGNHTLTVTADGFEKMERSFVMQVTRATEMTISLRPVGGAKTEPIVTDVPKAETKPATNEPPPPPPPLVVTQPVEQPKKSGRVWTYVAGGVAVASLGAGIGLGAASNGAIEQFTKPANGMPHTGDVQAQFDQAKANATGLATGANVAYGVAGAAAITAVILFFVEK